MKTFFFFFVTALLMMTGVALGQTEPMLVETNWLSAHLSDPGLVLLEVGPKQNYEAGHIAGARFISLEDIALGMNRQQDPKQQLTLELPPAETLRAKFESYGISSDSRIIVYFSVKNSFQSATRVIFTLDYIGLGGRTSLLNGGLPGWTAAGKPVTAEVPAAAKPGRVKATPENRNLVADAEFVKSLGTRANHRLIDARMPNFYNGTDATYEKKGHIPGAVNLPFAELLDEKLTVDAAKAARLFEAAGVKAGDAVVAYCHIGQQATAVVFAARLTGHAVRLYDGSFQDWAVNARGPVEK